MGTTKVLEQRDLFYNEGNSDKEYHIQIISLALGGFNVECQWGRVGNTLQTQRKLEEAGYDQAKKLYDKVVAEKVGKGYQDKTVVVGDDLKAGLTSDGKHYSAYVSPKASEPVVVAVGGKRKIRWQDVPPVIETFIPQLLNPIEESEVEKYLKDDAYGMQEKKDGRHQMIRVTAGGIKVYNKKGKEVAYPAVWGDSLKENNPLVLDGEAIGDTFHTFDLLEVGGEDFRGQKYQERWTTLDLLAFGSSIKVVPLAIGYKAKKAMYDAMVAGKKEGVVFKRLEAVYKPGKAHSDMWKAKFYAEASVRVCKGREGKHSIGMEVLDSGKWVRVGNCTVGSSIPLPPIGSVVEVKFLYAYKGGSLYQPSFKEPRDDVDESECVIGQLKYKAEEEL